MPNFDTTAAKCHFFQTSSYRTITCEGITDDCINILSFFSSKKKTFHFDVYCKDKCEYCEIYRMLMEKYEE